MQLLMNAALKPLIHRIVHLREETAIKDWLPSVLKKKTFIEQKKNYFYRTDQGIKGFKAYFIKNLPDSFLLFCQAPWQ